MTSVPRRGGSRSGREKKGDCDHLTLTTTLTLTLTLTLTPTLTLTLTQGYVGVSSSCLMGLNRNRGQSIHLRLRTDDWKGLRPYAAVVQVRAGVRAGVRVWLVHVRRRCIARAACMLVHMHGARTVHGKYVLYTHSTVHARCT